MRGRCRDCHETGVSHCSDPVGCGAWIEMTGEMQDILMHALGDSPKNKPLGRTLGWRNYYCTTDGDPQCENLVKMGLMARGKLLNHDRDRFYHVTRDGERLCGLKEEVENFVFDHDRECECPQCVALSDALSPLNWR